MPSEYTVQEKAKNVQLTHLVGTITTNSCPQKRGEKRILKDLVKE